MPWPGDSKSCPRCGVGLVWVTPYPVDGRMPEAVKQALTRLGRWEQLEPPTFALHRCDPLYDVMGRLGDVLERLTAGTEATAPPRTPTPAPAASHQQQNQTPTQPLPERRQTSSQSVRPPSEDGWLAMEPRRSGPGTPPPPGSRPAGPATSDGGVVEL